MTIQIYSSNGKVLIQGDEQVLAKLPEGFDASTIDLTDVRVDAHNLAIAYDYASYKDVEHVKFYAALKQAFIEQQALAKVERDKPRESHAPAITSQSTKQVSV